MFVKYLLPVDRCVVFSKTEHGKNTDTNPQVSDTLQICNLILHITTLYNIT
jgi:hypothetical protein